MVTFDALELWHVCVFNQKNSMCCPDPLTASLFGVFCSKKTIKKVMMIITVLRMHH